ncbi:MAG: hypothetical protein NC548_61140 [Lachnospiraceae bacterium]|nr:hypothetical protein [Lachnospiraceae bacterium]
MSAQRARAFNKTSYKMELKEFIKTALADITNAVKESQSDLTNGSIVCPKETMQLIEFDIAVTTADNMSAKAEMGTSNLVGRIFAIGGKAEGEYGHSQLSRIKFEIPVQFPAGFDVVSQMQSAVRNARPEED